MQWYSGGQPAQQAFPWSKERRTGFSAFCPRENPSIYRPVILCFRTAQKRLLRRLSVGKWTLLRGKCCYVLYLRLFFFSLIKYKLSNHFFVFSSSPKSPEKRGKHLSFGMFRFSGSYRFLEYQYNRVLSFSRLLLLLLLYVLFDDIGK